MNIKSKNQLKIVRSLVHVGNLKIGRNTMIFNMCSARNCPSRALGLCRVCLWCYADKAEKFYKRVLPYRLRQEWYWNSADVNTVIDDFTLFVGSKRKKVEYFRFNEAGDFGNINDIIKLRKIALSLYKSFGIITYGYTARIDLVREYLKHHRLPPYLITKTSGYEISGTNSTCVIKNGESVPKGYVLCPGKNCMTECRLCTKKCNIAFRKH